MDTPLFNSLSLPDALVEAVSRMGFERATPIQALAIPPALEGRDLIGVSHTGSGKTAAFTLPMLARIDPAIRAPQALVLCPTRELAVQVCEEANRFGSCMRNFQAVPVYGGAPMDRQIRALRAGAQVVIGTPGRLLDHLRRGTFDPKNIRMLVLDEADRMLDMGFREEMEELMAALPKERQTLCFSATMSREVSRLIEKATSDPLRIEPPHPTRTVGTIEQSWYEVRGRSKVEVLTRILDLESPRLAIIFCNTKRVVDECTEALLARGYSVDRLHGDITQQMRERTVQRFRDGQIELLVATDVAARGLDIDEIDIVFNYDLPQDPEDYVHRIGRTGRAGREGKAVSFVFGREIYRLTAIERDIRQKIARKSIPSVDEVEGRRRDRLYGTVKERLEAANFQNHTESFDRLLENGFAPSDIASALFTLLRESEGREAEAIAEDNPNHQKERPAQPRRGGDFDNGRPARENYDRGGQGGRFERGPRAERGDRPDHGDRRGGFREIPREAEAGMTRLFLSLGKEDGVRPGDIAGMLYREATLPDGAVGRIAMLPRHTLIEINEDCAEKAIRAVRGSTLRGRAFRMDHDRGPR